MAGPPRQAFCVLNVFQLAENVNESAWLGLSSIVSRRRIKMENPDSSSRALLRMTSRIQFVILSVSEGSGFYRFLSVFPSASSGQALS